MRYLIRVVISILSLVALTACAEFQSSDAAMSMRKDPIQITSKNPALELSKFDNSTVHWKITNTKSTNELPKVFVLAGTGQVPQFGDTIDIEENPNFVQTIIGETRGKVTLTDIDRDVNWVMVAYIAQPDQIVPGQTHIPATKGTP